MSGWGNQGNQGWGKPTNQGWGGQGQGQGQQGWGNQGQQGWGQQGHQQGGQGWGQQGQQGQQGWGQQGQNQGWGQQGQQNQGWGQNQNQGFSGQTTSLFNANQDYVLVTALDNDKVADVSQGNDNTRFKLILWSKSGDKNQRFRIRAAGNGKYQILSNAGGALQVPNGSGANGVQLLAGQQANSPG